MDRDEILQRSNEVFQHVFDDDSIYIDEDTTSDDIDDWDSLEHMTLIDELEDEFNIHFNMHEVSTMKDVGEMVDIIAERTKK